MLLQNLCISSIQIIKCIPKFENRISIKTKLPVHIAEDPLRAVARGTGIALKNIDNYQFLIKA